MDSDWANSDWANSNWATLGGDGNRPVIRFERRLAHPQEKVWKAITDPAEMAHWFPATVETEPTVGARIRFSFEGHNPDMDPPTDEGEVLEFDPPKVYAFRWNDSVLRFELVPQGSGCLLVFTHTLGGAGTWGDRASTARQAAGWDGCLSLLAARLEGRKQSLEGNWWFERAEGYVERFGLAEGEVREIGDGYLVRFERDLVQPVETAWRTLLDGQQAPDVGALTPAGATNIDIPAGAVTDVDSPHVLEYVVPQDGAPAGRVRFELGEQRPIGTRLVLTHTVPARLADQRATILAAWQTYLEQFFAALHGEARSRWPAERVRELAERYAARL